MRLSEFEHLRERKRERERRERKEGEEVAFSVSSTLTLSLAFPLLPPTLQSKKRGFSLEEKRQALLGIFHDSADVFVLKVCVSFFSCFSLSIRPMFFPLSFFFLSTSTSTSFFSPHLQHQDIEKLAPKRGVVLQAVKDVLQGLVDEDLVHCEKIGISNFFW